MKVTFSRTAIRRYRVSIEGPGIEPLAMEPAPGYDDRLPHDAAHFIVENELGIRGAVFGQLAAGGTAGTFRSTELRKPKKTKRRSASLSRLNREDALFSEHAVYAAQSRWNGEPIQPTTKISPADIERICRKFDEFSALWSKLEIGGSITLEWNPTKQQPAR